jgi:hypothetical protein
MLQFYYNSSLIDKEEALIEGIYEKHRYVYFNFCGNHNVGSKYGGTIS